MPRVLYNFVTKGRKKRRDVCTFDYYEIKTLSDLICPPLNINVYNVNFFNYLNSNESV